MFLDVLLFCHRTLVQPAVTVKAGKMIKPIAVPKSKLRSVGAEKANLILIPPLSCVQNVNTCSQVNVKRKSFLK